MFKRLAFVTAVGLATCLPAMADPLVIFAAASLKGPLDQVIADSGTDAVVSYAGSGAIAAQIAQGAPADLVVLAAPEWAADLDAKGLLAAASLTDIVSNSLVLIAPAPAAVVGLDGASLTLALGDGRLAIGAPASVPAGAYGMAALQTLGLWDIVATRLLETENVRAALAIVAAGEAPLGLVYNSDAVAEPRVAVVARLPDESHPPIRYQAAIVVGRDSADAQAFLAMLRAPAAQAVFIDAGFLPPASAP